MNDVPNDPIARVAQRWVAPESVDTLVSTIRTAGMVALHVNQYGQRQSNPAAYVIEARKLDLTGDRLADFTRDINRAVAEWLREVANELDPPRCPDGVSVVSDDGADVADALDADGGVVVAGKVECMSCDTAGPIADTPEVAARNWNRRAKTFTWFPVSRVFPPQHERLLVATRDPSVFGGRGWQDAYVDDSGAWRDCDDDKRLHRPGVNEVTHWARVPLPEER